MLRPFENRVAASPQNQSLALYKAGQEYKGLNFYSVEDLRQRLPISSQVSPFATRLVKQTYNQYVPCVIDYKIHFRISCWATRRLKPKIGYFRAFHFFPCIPDCPKQPKRRNSISCWKFGPNNSVLDYAVSFQCQFNVLNLQTSFTQNCFCPNWTPKITKSSVWQNMTAVTNLVMSSSWNSPSWAKSSWVKPSWDILIFELQRSWKYVQ